MKKTRKIPLQQRKKDASDEKLLMWFHQIFFVGRVIRKATEPVPPITLKKLRTEQVVEPELCVATPAKSSKMKSYNVRSSVKRDGPLTEKMTLVLENNETFYENNLKSRKQEVTKTEIDLGKLLPSRVVNVSDIKLSFVGEGDVSLMLKYIPDTD